MPFINLTKKKTSDDQKVVPADVAVEPDANAPAKTTAEPVKAEPAQPVEVQAETPVETPEAPIEPVASESAPVENGNGENDHLKSKEVPTSLPGQEVEVTDEGVKEIKGPPLPGETPTANPELPAETPVEAATPVADPIIAAPDPVPADVPTEAVPAPEVATETTTEATVETPVETITETPGEVPTATPVPAPEEPVTTVDSVMENVDSNSVSGIDLADKLPTVEGTTPPETVPAATETPAAPEETTIQSLDPNVSTIENYFELVLTKNASDLHFAVGYPVFIRVDGSLERIGSTALSAENAEKLIYSVLTEDQKKAFLAEKEIDLSFEFKEDARFRINVYFEKGHLAAAFRYLPTKIRTIEELKLPQIVHEFIEIPQGLILVTGPTGSGKSTTIAAMVQEINQKQKNHIITIEDPIEYVYPKATALVDQRELEKDTHNWANALRSVLRQDPNVVVVGEMRDLETIAAAITVSETGHMVYATLHTNTAVQTIDRIIDVFPPHQQAQIRSQLSNVITAVIAQRLIPVKGGGRRAVTEIMIGTAAVKNAIREGKTYQIDNIIQTSYDVGMITLERALVDLIREGELTVEEAQKHTTKPEELIRLMKKS